MSYVAILNPAAGGGRAGREGERALGALRAEGVRIDEVLRTSAPGEATRLARQAWDRGARSFLVVGGDGTSHEVINGVVGQDTVPTIAMLPLGTGNSYLRDFGIRGARDAMAAIARGAAHDSDVVRVEHDGGAVFSFNIVGLGFSAEAGARTNARYKPLGPAGYVIAVLETAARLQAPVFPLRLDGGPLDARPAVLLSFSNSRFTAGAMEMAPNAKVDDGELDVIRIGAMSRRKFVASFPSIFRGRHIERPEVEQGRARRVELALDHEVDCMIDGEILRLRPRSVSVVPCAMKVIA
jgi:diacylglycerol kinase (ATP)